MTLLVWLLLKNPIYSAAGVQKCDKPLLKNDANERMLEIGKKRKTNGNLKAGKPSEKTVNQAPLIHLCKDFGSRPLV